MKKILIIIGSVIAFLLILLILLPIFFKGDIIRIIEKQSAKYIKAELQIGDLSLSMFKDFPYLHVGIENVTLSGIEEFANDTITHIPFFGASVNVMSLISGNEIIIEQVALEDARLFAKVLASGKANWDIVIADATEETEEAAKEEEKTAEPDKAEQQLVLNEIAIKNMYLEYDDIPGATHARIADLDLKFSGNLSETQTRIKIALGVNDISAQQNDTVWVEHANIGLKADADANLKEMAFQIKQGELTVNDLKVNLTGAFAMPADAYSMNLKLNIPDTRFESLLALIPESYKGYLDGTEAKGAFNLQAQVNGEYDDNHLPSFDVNMNIHDTRLTYSEATADAEKIVAELPSLDLKFNGNSSGNTVLVNLMLALNNLTAQQGNTVWLSKAKLSLNSEVDANINAMAFSIRKNTLALNDLKIDLTGDVTLGDKYKLNLLLNTPDTKFESLLALVPQTYQQYLEGIKTSGEFSLQAKANGELYENHIPSFNADLKIHDGRVQYPELPESIEKINLDLNVKNPGGNIDNTTIDLKKMSLAIAGNPVSLNLKISNLNDPLLQGGLKGVIQFASLQKALPMGDMSLQGSVTADVNLNGKYQYIEKEQYERFNANGNITLKDILFKSADFPEGISVPQGNLSISPAQLKLTNLTAKIYSSDVTLQGTVSNYLPYVFKDQLLKGNFTLQSNRINLNEFMSSEEDNNTQATPEQAGTPDAATTTASAPLEIPRNLNLQLATNINTLLFDDLTIKNIKGNISLADAIASLNNLNMNLLEGSLGMNGSYNAQKPEAAVVNFDLNAAQLDLNSAYNSFSFIKESLPIAMNCSGKVSSVMKFAATLDPEMSPVMTTLNGGGYLESKEILIKDNPTMNQLSSILKNQELSRISLSSLKINFKLQNGNIVIEPFQTKIAGNPMTMYGNQSVDGKMDYTMSMKVNKKDFGGDINKLLANIPGSDKVESLDVDVKIGGTLDKPTVKPDLSKAIKALSKEAEKELKEKAKDGLVKELNKLFK